MKGRLTGSPEYDRAADYVVGKLKAYGLKPAGAKGWLQPVSFTEQRVIAERSSAALIVNDREQPLEIGKDLIFRDAISAGRALQPAVVEAPLVFVGYGLRIPKAGYDDFAGLDLKGKIAVVISGGPAELPRPIKSAKPRAAETWRRSGRAGRGGGHDHPAHAQVHGHSLGAADEPGRAGGHVPGRPAPAGDRRPTLHGSPFNPAEAEKLFAALPGPATASPRSCNWPMRAGRSPASRSMSH